MTNTANKLQYTVWGWIRGMFSMQCETTTAIETLITVEDGCLEYKKLVLPFIKNLLENKYPYSSSLF